MGLFKPMADAFSSEFHYKGLVRSFARLYFDRCMGEEQKLTRNLTKKTSAH